MKIHYVSEGNERYVKETMLWNAQNEELSIKQHRALAVLSTYRHKIHSDKEALYYSSSSSNRKYRDFLLKTMPVMLSQAGLPELDLRKDFQILMNDVQAQKYDTEGLPSSTYFRSVAVAIAETINVKIEDYLLKIDLEYGTQYAPTKIARLRTCA